MNVFYKGDIHGRNSFGSLGVRGHHRPAHYDFGSDFHQHHVRLDDVEPDVGKSDSVSDIRCFQLSFGQSQRKDFK